MQRRASLVCGLTSLTTVTVFLRVTLGINLEVNCTVTSKDGTADLMCKIPSHMDVVQITWQKRTGSVDETLVTHSKRFGVKISNSYENRISVLQSEDPGTSSIALSQPEKEDDACFTAIFNVYPNGALRGNICLPKIHGVREVICKSPPDFSVTLDPPQIKTQYSEPNGSIIQIGRWLSGTISPVCKFQLQTKTRTKRNVHDQEEVFTIECKTSGTQRATITWNNEGRPISKEEKENITGDVIAVTSILQLSMSSLSEHKGISCTISFDKDLHLEKNLELFILRTVIISLLLVLLLVVIFAVWRYIKNRKQPNSPKKEDKAENGSLTPLNRKEPHTPVTNEAPGSETKQRKGFSQKRNLKIPKQLF